MPSHLHGSQRTVIAQHCLRLSGSSCIVHYTQRARRRDRFTSHYRTEAASLLQSHYFLRIVTMFPTVNPPRTVSTATVSSGLRATLSGNPRNDFHFCGKNMKIVPERGLSMDLERKQSHCRFPAHHPHHCGLSVSLWNDPHSRETTEWAYLLLILIHGFILGLDRFDFLRQTSWSLHCQVEVEGAGSMQRFTGSTLS